MNDALVLNIAKALGKLFVIAIAQKNVNNRKSSPLGTISFRFFNVKLFYPSYGSGATFVAAGIECNSSSSTRGYCNFPISTEAAAAEKKVAPLQSDEDKLL